jgi:hypothetical protein
MTIDGGPRIALVEDADAGERERMLFGAARERYGLLPDTVRVMVGSASAGEICLAAGELNGRASLSRRGVVEDDVFAGADAASLDHGTVLDIAAVIAENTLGSYVNNIARTPLDGVLRRTAEEHLQLSATGVSR